MTSIIYKQQLNFVVGQHIKIVFPYESEILSCQFQDYELCIWYKFRKEEICIIRREFIIYGTGWEIDIDEDYYKLNHISTLQIDGYVWHIFEILNK